MRKLPERLYTAAELLAQKEAGYEEARKFCDRYRRALEDILWEREIEAIYKVARKALNG